MYKYCCLVLSVLTLAMVMASTKAQSISMGAGIPDVKTRQGTGAPSSALLIDAGSKMLIDVGSAILIQ